MRGWGLRPKLVAAFLAVILAAGVVLVVILELVAPAFYRTHAVEMARAMGNRLTGDAAVEGTEAHTLQDDLERGFNQALSQSLLLAALITVPLALVVSAAISRRIVAPVSLVSLASARIAAGRYRERLPAAGHDELGELTANFNRMAEALEQTEARRVELIGTVSHELRTPLAGVKGYAEGMVDGVFSVEHAAEAIAREVDRLERLLGDLQHLSAVEAGALTVRCEPVALDALAREVCAQLEPRFAKKQLALVCETQPLTVSGDADRLKQVLHNLLSNALRHTALGRVRVRVVAEDHGALLEVADSGEGIPEADLPHVFERFYRADKSRSRGEDVSLGAGVGLTVAKHLVEQMGGTITLSSAPGAGTTARVALGGWRSSARAALRPPGGRG